MSGWDAIYAATRTTESGGGEAYRESRGAAANTRSLFPGSEDTSSGIFPGQENHNPSSSLANNLNVVNELSGGAFGGRGAALFGRRMPGSFAGPIPGLGHMPRPPWGMGGYPGGRYPGFPPASRMAGGGGGFMGAGPFGSGGLPFGRPGLSSALAWANLTAAARGGTSSNMNPFAPAASPLITRTSFPGSAPSSSLAAAKKTWWG